jgi:hypothetical protein
LEQAGIVTAIARSGDFALSGPPGAFDRDKIEDELLRVPTIAVIKQVDQAAYMEILAAAIDAFKVGKSQAELHAITQPVVAELVKKYIPVSSDGAILEMTSVLVSEMDAIDSKNPDACYRFLYPSAGGTLVMIADYISPELQQRDLKATTSVIETGATNPQKIPTEADVDGSLKTVVASLLKKYNAEDLALLDNSNPPIADRPRICQIAGALYKEVMLQPGNQAQILRYLFSQQ